MRIEGNYNIQLQVIFTYDNILESILLGVSNLGKGDGSDFSVEVYVNREASPVFRADFKRQLCCQASISWGYHK